MSLSVIHELLGLTERIAASYDVPPVRRIYIPEPLPHENRHTEFGVVELEDGCAGLYYAWLGESQQDMQRHYLPKGIEGSNSVRLLPLLEGNSDAERSVGMAVVNAVTTGFFRHAGYRPPEAGDSLGSLNAAAGDHVGMVGYFPSLVERLRVQGIRLTVIERKSRFLDGGDERIVITNKPHELRRCNKILATASTLLNDSIDEILEHCRHAEIVAVVGPTAGLLPDPLFRRNVTAVGGTEILDAAATITAIRNDTGLSNSTRKYLITRDDYPGIDALLARLEG